MIFRKKDETVVEAAPSAPAKYPGTPDALDGSSIVVEMETAASEAAGAYPITPSTQMGEGWAVAYAAGKPNVNGRRLLFFEPEGEHAAAAVTAGMSMTGLRATNFSSGQGIVYMHESLYPAVGKRLTYVLNVAARAITKHSLNVHAGHDDYHAVDDAGFFQLFGKDVQEAGDLTLIAHRIAELSLNPGISAQDGFLTSHQIESARVPERDLIREYLGDPSDIIDCPTPAQRLVFGPTRRRIPELYDMDNPAMLGVVQNQDAYAQGIAAQRPFYFDHVRELADRAMAEYGALTGRYYARAMGYRLDDAEYVIAGMGTLVSNAEAVADYLRESRGIKVGVLNMTMFRPFPADLVTKLLRGKKAVAVLERTDQPLAVDPPMLREIRAAMSQAVENSRSSNGTKPFPDLATIAPDEMPDFYSGGFGFGSRDLQPGDVIAAIDNMLPEGLHQRQFYLGFDFIRKGTRLPKLQIWQEQLLEAYPHLATLALPTVGDVNLLPPGAISMRMHSVGGWGAITTGKNVAMTVSELCGLQVKANPKYGSEKKGQPTTFYATMSRDRYRLTSELKHVNVVLSPDPNVFRHSDPLAGMEQGGVFVIQAEGDPADLWRSLPEWARTTIRDKQIKIYALDGFAIAAAEASDAELRYRMQGAAFMGAFFKAAGIMQAENLTEETVFNGIASQLTAKFGKLGQHVVDDNLRVIRRGYDEVLAVPTDIEVAAQETSGAGVKHIPALMDIENAEDGIGNPGRFYEQVCSVCASGQDVIADPFVAISAMPAVSSSFRDMTGIRFEVPNFVAEKCTGCSQCWTQCPDAAIPGLVNSVEDIIDVAIQRAGAKRSTAAFKSIAKPVGKEVRKLVDAAAFKNFGDVMSTAYTTVADKLNFDEAKRANLNEEFAAVNAILAEFPLARTTPFWSVPERKAKGSGGLLSITINPEACKGCNICVEVCPEHALTTIKQDESVVEKLRRNWDFWQALPDTKDDYVNVSSIEEGIGVLPSLLLKKNTYRSMVGGDGACMGCGEKTAVHLVTSAVVGMMQPRVASLVTRLEGLIAQLDEKARGLVAKGADLDLAAVADNKVDVAIPADRKAELVRIAKSIKALKDLVWRYQEGPGGRGRAQMGFANSTGCSSVWASTWPFNPYPFPWVNHLFQDSPSVAIGVFEGHMRKMADNFVSIRRAELLAKGEYDEAKHEPFLANYDWRQFDDEEFGLCPPIMALGGDGAMLDIGFQNLSRLMASGKPIRVMVLDTQVYSNTGGQACTSGFTGQVADMSAYGAAQHGKQEVRKELALIAIAHRGTYVLQSSQASASHLLGGVLRGLQSRRPAVFNIYTPCPVEHGLADEWAPNAAKLALESRAFPFVIYDPDAGEAMADCLSLDGNPAMDDLWPTYTLKYVDAAGQEQSMELPMTTADWAATEARFKKHFKKVAEEKWTDAMLPFHEYMQLSADERASKQPFIWAIDAKRKLTRLSVSDEMVRLTADRLLYWSQLRELAGLKTPDSIRDAISSEIEARFDAQLGAMQAEYEAKMNQLKATYPAVVARRMAEGLIRATAGGRMTVAEILSKAESTPGLIPITEVMAGNVGAPVATAAAPVAAAPAAAASPAAVAAPAAAATAVAEPEEEGFGLEAYIESDRCTSCNECTNLNGKMFAYNADKQAYIKDPKAGTFAQLVTAAERCPAGLIHPGTPLNPKEKDIDKWLKRAEKFN